MTGNFNLFRSYEPTSKGGSVTFGDSSKGKILGEGSIGNPESLIINHVYYVDKLTHNLVSISQLSDSDLEITFDKKTCKIKDAFGKLLLSGYREENIYKIEINKLPYCPISCLVSENDNANLWHRLLGHIGFSIMQKLVSQNLIRGLPKFDLK
jgi:hypothetical protein